MKICEQAKSGLSIVAQMPLEKIQSPSACAKIVSAIAIAIFTLCTFGYYAFYANRYFANKKICAAKLEIESAIHRNDIEKIKKLFHEYPDTKKCINGGFQGSVPNLLHIAVDCKHIPIIEFLISQGADLHAIGRMGTPLAVAIRRGHLDMAEYLLQKKASPDLGDGIRSPLYMAMIEAPENKKFDLVYLLLKSNADPNIKNPFYTLTKFISDYWEIQPEKARELLFLLADKGLANEAEMNPQMLQVFREEILLQPALGWQSSFLNGFNQFAVL